MEDKIRKIQNTALDIGEKYNKADLDTRLEIANYMLGYKQYRRYTTKKRKKKKAYR